MRLNMALLIAHRQIYDQYYADDPMANPSLGFHLHGYHRQDQWHIIQLLTPWMLARLWFTESPPDIPIPDNWRAEADYKPLGPSIKLPEALGGDTAYLNYHSTLGHYLLQPITLDMTPYTDAEAVFDAWSRELQIQKAEVNRLSQGGVG
jgi:hypothetical protein